MHSRILGGGASGGVVMVWIKTAMDGRKKERKKEGTGMVRDIGPGWFNRTDTEVTSHGRRMGGFVYQLLFLLFMSYVLTYLFYVFPNVPHQSAEA